MCMHLYIIYSTVLKKTVILVSEAMFYVLCAVLHMLGKLNSFPLLIG